MLQSPIIKILKILPRRSHRIAAALLLGLLPACTSVPESPPETQASFRQLAAIDLFSTGYRQVSNKFIEKAPVSQLALDGMRGLSAIDPGLIVRRHGSTIELRANAHEIKRFRAPVENDVTAWASLTVDLWRAARKASSSIQKARAEKIYEAIFDGMLANLDGYSRYAGNSQARRNRNRRDGFGGIGIRFRFKNGLIHVYRVIKKTPAARVGLKRHDIITHVGDVPLKGLKGRDIIAQLHGPIHSIVNITVQRPGVLKPLFFEIERALIVPNTVTSRIVSDIVIVRIRSFNQKTLDRTAQHIRRAQSKNAGRLKGVILDLRGNPGGLLKQAIKIADLFLKQGSIVSTRGRHPDSFQYYEANHEDITNGLPIALLLDGKSASSSEVLAAALQDSGRAVIIGTTSYGKGTVQSVIRLPNEGEITLTWSRLHSPAGYIFHNLGVFPSICTSGQKGDASQPIEIALSQQAKMSSVYKTWWQSNGVTDEKRNSLRTICPPERRKNKLEIDIALHVLTDQMLYARALMTVPELAEGPQSEISLQSAKP